MTQETKECFKCKESKTLDSFSKNKRTKDGVAYYCKPCVSEYAQANRDKNQDKPCVTCGHPERAFRQTACSDCVRIRDIMSRYNITKEEATALKAQNHCDACGRSKEEAATERSFHVDHCHEGGHVRGLLCTYCNTALGMLLDDPIRIEKLKMYLNRAKYDEDNPREHG